MTRENINRKNRVALDREKLCELIDIRHVELGISWEQVYRDSGISHSTVHELRSGRGCNADTLLSLLLWLGKDRIELKQLVKFGQP